MGVRERTVPPCTCPYHGTHHEALEKLIKWRFAADNLDAAAFAQKVSARSNA